MRVGFGYDSHRLESGRRLVLGGVEFPGETGLKGHSDADVLIHAIIDALLGATALGDIGSHFPDTEAKWAGADSAKLLEAVVAELAAAGWRVGNVDATVICERPKLRARVDEMRARLAALMGVDLGQVSVKGKTNEKLDDVGAGLAIACHAVATVLPARQGEDALPTGERDHWRREGSGRREEDMRQQTRDETKGQWTQDNWQTLSTPHPQPIRSFDYSLNTQPLNT